MVHEPMDPPPGQKRKRQPSSRLQFPGEDDRTSQPAEEVAVGTDVGAASSPDTADRESPGSNILDTKTDVATAAAAQPDADAAAETADKDDAGHDSASGTQTLEAEAPQQNGWFSRMFSSSKKKKPTEPLPAAAAAVPEDEALSDAVSHGLDAVPLRAQIKKVFSLNWQ